MLERERKREMERERERERERENDEMRGKQIHKRADGRKCAK